MKKSIKLSGLDCANCAAKMEQAVRGIDGVNAVNVNFMTQKMTLEAEDSRFAAVLEAAKKLIGKIDPDVEVGV